MSDPGKKIPVVPAALLGSFILVTTLFSLWGFANDITNPLVAAFKAVFGNLTNAQSTWIQFAFYGGYATMAIPAALFIQKFSYKAGILLGLALYATGALLFIPAANTMQFFWFPVSLYILTFGLAFLETTANPFILSMGPEETATQRLNLAQALMCRSDLLLLDEPTNHLDLEAVIWLEDWLLNYDGTLLLISHDRDFLDRVSTHVAHLERQSLSIYKGNYSEFEVRRAEQLSNQQSMGRS